MSKKRDTKGSSDAKFGDIQEDYCTHYTYEGKVHLNKVIGEILQSKHVVACQLCPKNSSDKNVDEGIMKNSGKKKPKKKAESSGAAKVKICLTCQGCFCVANDIKADSHIRTHAIETQHWWATDPDFPSCAYCFNCDQERMVKLSKAGSEVVGTADVKFFIRGMHSLGNVSCFNAVLQSFLSLKSLRKEILGLDIPRTALTSIALRKLFVMTSSKSNEGGVLCQDNLISQICLKDPEFRNKDCEETLHCFLTALHEEEKEAWAGVPAVVDSTVVSSVFGGWCSITVSCNECSNFLAQDEEFFYLSLSVGAEVDEILKMYTDPKSSICESCSGAATRRILITRPPPVLMLLLKRKSDDQSQRFTYTEELQIGPYMDQRSGVDGQIAYRLVGGVLRNRTSGNYMANVKANRALIRGTPLGCFNVIDEQVNKTLLLFQSSVEEGEPHLLFYQKVMLPKLNAKMNEQDEVKTLLPSVLETVEGSQPMDPIETHANAIKPQPAQLISVSSPPPLDDVHPPNPMVEESRPCSPSNSMGEDSSLANLVVEEPLADVNMPLPQEPLVGVNMPFPQDEVRPWEFPRTQNVSRQRRNKIAQDSDVVGQEVGGFLNGYTLQGDIKPFYHCELITMCERGTGSRELNIHYPHLLRFSKGLAMDVCNGYQGLLLNLKEAAVNFAKKLLELKLTDTARKRLEQLASEEPASSLELKFIQMPKVHRQLKYYLHAPLTTRMHVYGDKQQSIRTPFPEKCSLVQRLLADVIMAHMAGRSWDGIFTLDDVEVYDETVFIAKKPMSFPIHPEISLEMIRAMEKDFKSIAQSILMKFKYQSASVPYLNVFLNMLSDMRRYESWWSDNIKAKAIRELIQHHPFLKPAMARSNLWSGIFIACRSYDAEETVLFKTVLDGGFRSKNEPWYHRSVLQRNRMLRCVLQHKDKRAAAETVLRAEEPEEPEETGEPEEWPEEPEAPAEDEAKSTYYMENYTFVIEFLRHVYHHGSEYSFRYRPLEQRGCGPRKQLMRSLDETEIAGAIALEEEAVKALTELLRHSAMSGLLKSVWECYKNCNYPSWL